MWRLSPRPREVRLADLASGGPPKLRRLTAREVLAALRAFDFEVVATRGSHAKLRRELADGTRQVLTIQLHRELATGTLRAVFRQATRFISTDELRPYFFR